jgi:hypothetical protein
MSPFVFTAGWSRPYRHRMAVDVGELSVDGRREQSAATAAQRSVSPTAACSIDFASIVQVRQ